MGAAFYLERAARAAGAGNTHGTLCAQPGTIVRGWLSPADLNVLEAIDKGLKPARIGPLVRMRITSPPSSRVRRTPRSISRLPLVPHGQDEDRAPIKPIERYVAGVSEIDQPFSEFRVEVFDRAAELRLVSKDLHASPDKLHSPLSSSRTLRREEAIKPLDIRQRRRRPDQAWQSGGFKSSPTSSLASQASASSAVRCRPFA